MFIRIGSAIGGDPMTLTCEKVGRALVCTVEGELDLSGAGEFKTVIEGWFKQYETLRHIVLDLSEVAFLDSSGLGAILGRYKYIEQLGGSLYVVGIRPNVRRIFNLSGIFKIIREAESIDKAVAGL